MNKIIFGIVAVVALFMLAESLTCNQCSLGLMGYCLAPNTNVCTTNTGTCFTRKATFPSFPLVPGFNSQGCIDKDWCTNSTSDTFLNVSFTTTMTCCNTTLCNVIIATGATSDATSIKLTVTTAIGAALVASLWGCM